MRLSGNRGGLMSDRSFWVFLVFLAFVPPLLVLRNVAQSPLQRVLCARPSPNHLLGDPFISLGVFGRAWNRWDDGDFSRTDDRAFAPYPDTWAVGEPATLPALVGYPFARLWDSVALGYNVALYCACILTTLGSGYFFRRLAGPGLAALAGALLFTWCPGRLNNLGVIGTLWAGLVPLGLALFLQGIRRRDTRLTVLGGLVWLALGLGSLYGLLMGSAVVGLVFAIVFVRERASRWRVVSAAVVLTMGLGLLAAYYSPLFRLDHDFGARVSVRAIEGHAADVLSLLHHAVFGGPLRDLLDRLVPGFPEGASALFPTLFALVVLPAGLLLRNRKRGARRIARTERSLWTWALVAGFAFASALGPTIRFAGHALFPGPYRLLVDLPGFSSLRGIHRWDQWFDLALVTLSVVVLGRLLRSGLRSFRRVVLPLAGLALLVDVWPREVLGQIAPPPSPFQDVFVAMPADAIVAGLPVGGPTAERMFVEQVHHGRRIVNGVQTFPPPIHLWLEGQARRLPLLEMLALLRELGARAVEIDGSVLAEGQRTAVSSLLASPAGRSLGWTLARGQRMLVLMEPRAPILVDPDRLPELRFENGTARVCTAAGRLVFRIGRPIVHVVVTGPSGTRNDVIDLPLVERDVYAVSVGKGVPAGSCVMDARTGRRLGCAVDQGPRG
jgi:hypothetical protein